MYITMWCISANKILFMTDGEVSDDDALCSKYIIYH